MILADSGLRAKVASHGFYQLSGRIMEQDLSIRVPNVKVIHEYTHDSVVCLKESTSVQYEPLLPLPHPRLCRIDGPLPPKLRRSKAPPASLELTHAKPVATSPHGF